MNREDLYGQTLYGHINHKPGGFVRTDFVRADKKKRVDSNSTPSGHTHLCGMCRIFCTWGLFSMRWHLKAVSPRHYP
jgi:hypothetical protein